MYKLVVLADDYTGALDTGVQFSQKGISTHVTTNCEWDFETSNQESQVLVIDMETRHLTPEEAHLKLYKIAMDCHNNGIQYIYKKTDSGLRGNIGSELSALVEVFKDENLIFVPAYPRTNRVTVKGIHYINGKRVTETEFGRDPFEPVRFDHVQKIIGEQSDVSTISVEIGDVNHKDFFNQGGKIYILDTEKEEDLQIISSTLKEKGGLRLFAGCAGFANYIPEIIGLCPEQIQDFYLEEKKIIVSGSVNDITLRQIEYAKEKGFDVIRITSEEKLTKNFETLPTLHKTISEIKEIYFKTGQVIVDMAGDREMVVAAQEYAKHIGIETVEIRGLIAVNAGKLVKKLADEGVEGTYIIIGGDTLRAVMDHLGFDILQPIEEIENGIVLSKVKGINKNIHIVSKSGGFGGEDALIRIEEYIAENSVNKQAYISM